ncbi:MAG: hypothetical protein DMF82_25285 [Acidobacteria bacterium]|nr:MAG: hypothetical protein DMF82_25285 [Acidobacteriota bacterium]
MEGQNAGRLTVLEPAFPAWQARVDGAGAPVLNENGFLAVDVGRGRHEVELIFRMTRARRVGLGVTLLSCAGAAVVMWRRRAA